MRNKGLSERDAYVLRVSLVRNVRTPGELVARLSVEGMPQGQVTTRDWPSLRAFRRLGADARLRLCRRLLGG